MNWLLIITIFSTDGSSISVNYPKSSEDICERTAANFMAQYEAEGTKAEYVCKPASPFVEKTN
jgi:hypothetical protein